MTLIYFILILGIVVLVHEFGHFIFAKKSGVYVYEFSIGMGPRLFKWTRKNDETEYSLRLLPIGGYCQLAGEEIDDDESVPKDKKFAKKTFGQKMMIAFAGIMNNFILAIILLFLIAIFNGAPQNKALVGEISEGFPAYTSGLQEGDEILTINGRDASSNDLLALELQVNVGKTIDMEVERNGEVLEFTIEPKKVKIDGEEYTVYKINKDSDYYLVYGENVETGKKGLYLYDSVDNTIQRYYNEEVNSLNDRLRINSFIIIGLISLIVIILIIFLITLHTKNNSKRKKKKEIKKRLKQEKEDFLKD